MSQHLSYDDRRGQQAVSPDLKYEQRKRSRSPISYALNSKTARSSSYEDERRRQEDRRIPLNIHFKVQNDHWRGPDPNSNVRRGDLEAKRGEIDTGMAEEEHRRREQDVRREMERRRGLEMNELRPQNEHGLPQVPTSVRGDDLRIMLEKSRTGGHNITPPPMPQILLTGGASVAMETRGGHYGNNPGPSYVQSTYTPIVPPQATKVPSFDPSRLGEEVNHDQVSTKLLSNDRSEVRIQRDDPREALNRNFKEDCDTVAHVTQMLLDEDPSLEKPLVLAMKGVLKKLMRKHLDAVQN